MNACWVFTLLTSSLCVFAEDMGIQFNETLTGYISPGDVPYQQGYDEGKAANRTTWFLCNFRIIHMASFVGNSSHHHVAQCTGHVFVHGLTGSNGAEIVDGRVDVFDNNVVNHELQMQYNLSFDADGTQYRLEGVKYIYGSDCSHLFEMSTTLYTHIVQYTKDQLESSSIVASGILTINMIGTINLLESIQFVGNGTDADKLEVLYEFGKFLLSSVEEDCLNLTNYETRFWYIWASDGEQGFLLDLIERPDKCEIRLETYHYNATPQVQKEWVNLDDLHITPTDVHMGDVTMSKTNVYGSVNNVSLALGYNVTSGANHFVPLLLVEASKGLIPDIYSRYGYVTGGQINHHSYTNTTALTFTTYTFKVGLKEGRWAMISAMNFTDKGTNHSIALKIEIVSVLIGKDFSLATSYVFYEGKEYHLNDPLFSQTQMTATGDIQGNDRHFGANLVSDNLRMDVKCQAPVSQFALLDHEGQTVIHTTVLGDCTVNSKFVCTKCALLEIKS
ncbi:uncharacterized protein LOC134186389 [Corticium candelabrum]|uniref:uncharacterized protein LOC134186389 n=1 Tax=Corticium candelabrum TaxID=121492 RepID=UPI002E26793B|nr:uncharacterized protein LOC134186389 [Corticium candelabrum]